MRTATTEIENLESIESEQRINSEGYCKAISKAIELL